MKINGSGLCSVPSNFTEQCPKIGDRGDEKMVEPFKASMAGIFKNGLEIAHTKKLYELGEK